MFLRFSIKFKKKNCLLTCLFYFATTKKSVKNGNFDRKLKELFNLLAN